MGRERFTKYIVTFEERTFISRHNGGSKLLTSNCRLCPDFREVVNADEAVFLCLLGVAIKILSSEENMELRKCQYFDRSSRRST